MCQLQRSEEKKDAVAILPRLNDPITINDVSGWISRIDEIL